MAVAAKKNNNGWFEYGDMTREQLEQDGRLVELAPLWRRLVSDLIDSTFYAVFSLIFLFNIMQISSYWGSKYEDLQDIMMKVYNCDTKETALFHLLIVLFIFSFEVWCLSQGDQFTIGGWTPGKGIMGIRVVYFQALLSNKENKLNTALAYPPGDLGYSRSFIRTLIKTISNKSYIPIFLFALVSPMTMTAYDSLSNTLVVRVTAENEPNFARRDSGYIPAE